MFGTEPHHDMPLAPEAEHPATEELIVADETGEQEKSPVEIAPQIEHESAEASGPIAEAILKKVVAGALDQAFLDKMATDAETELKTLANTHFGKRQILEAAYKVISEQRGESGADRF